MENYLTIKEANFFICRKMDGSGDHHAEQNKPDSESVLPIV